MTNDDANRSSELKSDSEIQADDEDDKIYYITDEKHDSKPDIEEKQHATLKGDTLVIEVTKEDGIEKIEIKRGQPIDAETKKKLLNHIKEVRMKQSSQLSQSINWASFFAIVPMLRIRYLWQVQQLGMVPGINYDSYLQTLKSIYSTQGGIHGLYRGGSAFLYLNINSVLLSVLLHRNVQIFHDDYLLNFSLITFLNCAAIYPLMLLHTNMATDAQRFRNVFDAVVKIYTVEGLRGFYRGFWPMSSLFVWFPILSKMKESEMITTREFIVSYAVISCLIYPIDTISRMNMVQARVSPALRPFASARQTLMFALRNGGVRSLYRGCGLFLASSVVVGITNRISNHVNSTFSSFFSK